MIVTELDYRRKKYLLVFITLGRQDTKEISDWIQKKLKTEINGTDFKENIDNLFYICEQKFGERPFIVDKKNIPAVRMK